jgi:DNA-binding XRE family transcriptional regulator
VTDDATNTENEANPAVARLAEEIRRLRKDADLSHAQLAGQIDYSRQHISLAERPRKGLPSADLVRALDGALHADGALMALREKAMTSRQSRRRSRAGVVVAGVSVPVSRPVPSAPTIDLIDRSPHGGEVMVAAPAGRFFAGSTIEARAYPAMDDGRVLAAVPPGFADDRFLRRPHRGLVIGVTDDANGVRLFGLGTRYARRRLARAVDDSCLLIARACALDDLTLRAAAPVIANRVRRGPESWPVRAACRSTARARESAPASRS